MNEKLKRKNQIFKIATVITFLAYFFILVEPVGNYYETMRTSPGWIIMLLVAAAVGGLLAWLSYTALLSRANEDTGYTGDIDNSPKRLLKIREFVIWWSVWSGSIFIMNLIWLSEL